MLFSVALRGAVWLCCAAVLCGISYGDGTIGAANTYDMVDKKKYMNKSGIAAYT